MYFLNSRDLQIKMSSESPKEETKSKHQVIFLTEEEAKVPSTVTFGFERKY